MGEQGEDKTVESLRSELEAANISAAIEDAKSESTRKLRELQQKEALAKIEVAIVALAHDAELRDLEQKERRAKIQASIETIASTPTRTRTERRETTFALGKALTPMLVTVVAAVTAYCGVNRHAQIVSDRELAMKQVELDRNFRSQVIDKYLALPDNISLNRRDMLAFIAATSKPTDPIRQWALDTKKALDDRAAEIEKTQGQFYGPSATKTQAYFCQVTINVPNAEAKTASVTRPVQVVNVESIAKDCRAFADNTCAEHKLDPKRCTEKFELITVPSGKAQIPGVQSAPAATGSAPAAAGASSSPPRSFDESITTSLLLTRNFCIASDEGFLLCAFDDASCTGRRNAFGQCVAKPKSAWCFAFERDRPRANCYVDADSCEKARATFQPPDLQRLSTKCESLTL